PDVTDTDDDNDGIPDTEDNNPKVADTTAPTVDASAATVTEGQEITPIPVTITDDNDTTEEVTGLPSGLTYDDANNQIIGTPDIITDWNDDAATGTYEGTRDFSVTITVTDEAGNVTEETIIITVQRDTDGDGTPDVTDTDDDNDGIPDTEDNNPKVADTTAPTVDASAATVTEGQAIT
ncbi:putative Ig domain-containing protein, partial [Macrococcoides canis]